MPCLQDDITLMDVKIGRKHSDVGTIEVTEQRTWVAVRSPAAAEAAAALGKTKIKKSKFKVHLIDEA